ncbi:DUF1800 domain-containing protein [Paracoccus aminophilus]|uniref:DUF1800 domain-containing protein n=1 Tax=Paracoccus aminophilus JCM 7686 TaxID=1367847 RepID=S5Y1D8_PARAH|nr:DUF1800 domain-containing protein [Paracoccus aminophilus]AGT09510.1 hypothetical protein JCM7686_2442 [Paracoccus aminophilus JCM 7686]
MEFGFPELAAIRLGFGLSPHQKPPADVDAVLASVAAAGPGPDAVSLAEAQAAQLKLSDLAQEARNTNSEEAKAAYGDYARDLRRVNWRDLQRRVARGVTAPVGFGERLVQFWADHFTVRGDGAAQQVLASAFVDEAIRPHLNGRFEDMFIAADTHPMMLLYLNQNGSVGPNSKFAISRAQKQIEVGLNENLAREALELHSIGVGASYTQKDVRALAELLTGLSYNPRAGAAFNANRSEPGTKVVLGKSYGGNRAGQLGDVQEALRDIARHPATADYISHKLAVHFLSDTPDPAVVETMASVWRKTKGNLPDVYRVLITHPALADSFRQKARQPFDFVVAGLRALGLDGETVLAWDERMVNRVLVDPLTRMGQRWMSPIGPNGWPEEAEAWIAPQTLAARINWSLDAPRRVMSDLPDPRGMLVASLGGTRSEMLDWAVPKAESEREGVALILASNDFNRR